MELIRLGARKAARRPRLDGHTLFICAAGLLIALAGLSGCGSSPGNSAQSGPSSSSSSPSPSPSCSTSAFMHRSSHMRASQQATLTAALVPMPEIPDPDINLNVPRPEDQENQVQQEQEQEHWANDGINSAHENPKTSQPGNSLLQESDAVAETEEVTLWEDDLTEPDTFGEDVCKDIETLKNDAKHLDDLNQICADVLQQVSTGTPFGALCAVVQDANNKFDQVFPCNDLQVAQWLVNRLSDVFCTTRCLSN